VDFDRSFAQLSDKNVNREPWRSLPAEIADVIEPELEATTDEILATIAREVPDYARPLEGSFGRGVRTGVSEALRQFVELIRSPSGARGPGREVYVGLGSGEQLTDRGLQRGVGVAQPAPSAPGAAVAHPLPVPLPGLAPGDASPAHRARLLVHARIVARPVPVRTPARAPREPESAPAPA